MKYKKRNEESVLEKKKETFDFKAEKDNLRFFF